MIGLPQDLTFGELQRRLGRALTADPYFIYRLDGTNELVTIEMEAPRGSGGSRITGIYLVDDTFTQRLARLWPASSPE